MLYYGKDTQRFVTLAARTSAIVAMANLVLLFAVGVDFVIIWCFLLFLPFLHPQHRVPNVINPMIMKKGLHVSFLEIMLSLVIWSFLLGLPGAFLAVPLTLAVRRFNDMTFAEREDTLAQAPG